MTVRTGRGERVSGIPDVTDDDGQATLSPQQDIWSGREDLNLRPPPPQGGALPGCATPRWNRDQRRGNMRAEVSHDTRECLREKRNQA
jgi:hypothetical protein